MYKKTRLNNGLTVVTHQMPNRFSVSLGIWVRVGARYEAKDISGISHFLEHLVFKGTKKRNCEQLKQAIEGIGGSLNGFTSEELTCYLAKVPARHRVLACDVLWDMVFNANLAAADVEMERRVILEEIRMYKDLPSHLSLELLMELLWPSQPLGRNIAGDISSVSSISRERLFSYMKDFYQMNNIVLVACGNLEHQRFLKECQQYFSLPAPAQDKKRAQFLSAIQKKSGAQINCQFKDTKQTHLALGVYALPRAHPQRFCLGLLHIILGANMSSRLFREVREKRGLAYEISTALRFLQDTGAFIVHAGVDNQRAGEALKVILEQLVQIKRKIVEKEELNRAKEYYTGQLRLALEGTSDHMLWLGENFVSLNKFQYAQEIIRRVKKVQADDLKSLANEILQNCHLNLSIVGPVKEEDKKRIETLTQILE